MFLDNRPKETRFLHSVFPAYRRNFKHEFVLNSYSANFWVDRTSQFDFLNIFFKTPFHSSILTYPLTCCVEMKILVHYNFDDIGKLSGHGWSRHRSIVNRHDTALSCSSPALTSREKVGFFSNAYISTFRLINT